MKDCEWSISRMAATREKRNTHIKICPTIIGFTANSHTDWPGIVHELLMGDAGDCRLNCGTGTYFGVW
jgi:hypothetical protein